MIDLENLLGYPSITVRTPPLERLLIRYSVRKTL